MKTIMDNENKLLEELGITNANPFKTPEGYFEELTSRVMKNIPNDDETLNNTTEEKKAKVVSMDNRKTIRNLFIRWTSVAAACIALVFLGVYHIDKKDRKQLADNQTTVSAMDDYDDEYAEDLLSYSMVDETDVYYYLSGSEY